MIEELIAEYELILCFFKHTQPERVRRWVNVMAFPENPSICPVQFLKYYLVKTAQLWHTDVYSLFFAVTNSYKSMTSQTLDRRIKQLMVVAGINTLVFKQHNNKKHCISIAQVAYDVTPSKW